MKNFKLTILILTICIICVSCEKDDITTYKKPTQEEYQQVIKELDTQEEATYFTNLLKSANIQFADSSKLTIFVMIDNPYNKSKQVDGELFVKNHIIKGTYRLKDFSENTQLTAINGNKILVKNIDKANNFFRLNETSSCGIKELEIDGNIIHFVYSPILCSTDDYSNYLDKTKILFSEFIEFCYVFDAILTDISPSINSSWEQIDNHSFDSRNVQVEKLWFDAYYLFNRIVNLNVYSVESGNDIFAENVLLQSTISCLLLNFFGGIPIYDEPTEFNDQLPRASVEEVRFWTINSTEQAEYWANNSFIKNAAIALRARTYFIYENLPNFTKPIILSDLIIKAGAYSLESSSSNVYSAINNVENIFAVNNSKKINSELSNQKTVLPICRLSETYLTTSYCGMKEGRMVDAFNKLQYYQEKKGFEISAFYPSVLDEKLKEYWLFEFKFDGLRFSILKKFGLTSEILSLPEHKKLLPIPMKEIVDNTQVTQNPGY